MTGMKLRDGDITLYHRRDSKNWQADIRLPDGGRHTVSLRTANEKTAKDKVILIYEDMYFRYKHGLTAVVVLFKDAADAWLKELRAEVRAGSRNERTVIDYEPVVERWPRKSPKSDAGMSSSAVGATSAITGSLTGTAQLRRGGRKPRLAHMSRATIAGQSGSACSVDTEQRLMIGSIETSRLHRLRQ